jgi:hypothetical protein
MYEWLNLEVEEKGFWTDHIGQVIRVGDKIVYGTLLGRSASLATGIVLGYSKNFKSLRVQRDKDAYCYNSDGYKASSLLYANRILVITGLKKEEIENKTFKDSGTSFVSSKEEYDAIR